MTVYKYPLKFTDAQEVLLPEGARVLTVRFQNGVPMLWARVDPEEPERESWTVRIAGTGHEIPASPGRYVGTDFLQEGTLVFHFFARPTIGEDA